ncbi:hypothetical protein BaRGS_00038074 [Batillaria attramentaria]|uniref:Uncharacterized protein n=1 Tax=Batillaria attramentaria TaxID=370345 RepID=A0ABD0J6V0_9CAEN
MRLLLKYGADQGAEDNAGQTPLDLAYSVGNKTAVSLLDSKYKKTNKCLVCGRHFLALSMHSCTRNDVDSLVVSSQVKHKQRQRCRHCGNRSIHLSKHRCKLECSEESFDPPTEFSLIDEKSAQTEGSSLRPTLRCELDPPEDSCFIQTSKTEQKWHLCGLFCRGSSRHDCASSSCPADYVSLEMAGVVSSTPVSSHPFSVVDLRQEATSTSTAPDSLDQKTDIVGKSEKSKQYSFSRFLDAGHQMKSSISDKWKSLETPRENPISSRSVSGMRKEHKEQIQSKKRHRVQKTNSEERPDRNDHATLQTVSDSPSASGPDWRPSFSKHWQFSAEFSGKGGTLQGDSSDIVLHVPEAAVTSGTVVVKGAVSTDLDRVHKELGLRHDERIVSPVIEYFAGEDFAFQKPVGLSIPHFASSPEGMSVYWFQKGDFGFRIQKLKMECDVDNTDEKYLNSGIFRFTDGGCVEVLIRHFCGFVCTHCDKESPQLRLRLYGAPFGEKGSDVNLFLLVWDNRLDIKDFRESEEDQKYIMSKDLDAPGENDRITKLGACVVFEQHLENDWIHKLKPNGKPWFPNQQVVNLEKFKPSCEKSSPKRLEWILCRKAGRMSDAAFQCFVDVGYLDPSGEGFLDSHETQTFPVEDLTLPANKGLRAVVYEKSPTQCEDTNAGPILEENGQELEKVTLKQCKFPSDGATVAESPVVARVLEGTALFELFHRVAAGHHAEVYPMQQRIRGVLLLINNKSFSKARANHIELEDRDGTDIDGDALADLFHQLNFMIVAKDNCTSKVSKRVSEAETPDAHRHKQQPVQYLTMNKKLYFFPGLVKPRHSGTASGATNGTP